MMDSGRLCGGSSKYDGVFSIDICLSLICGKIFLQYQKVTASLVIAYSLNEDSLTEYIVPCSQSATVDCIKAEELTFLTKLLLTGATSETVIITGEFERGVAHAVLAMLG